MCHSSNDDHSWIPQPKGTVWNVFITCLLTTALNVCLLIGQHSCQSEGNALYFHGGEGLGHTFASTRDIDLHREEGRSYWEEDFESAPLK